MIKLEQLRNDTETSYSGPKWIDEIAEAVAKKLGGQGYKPGDGLTDRVAAWQRMREPNRPETHTADGRPIIKVSPEAQWGAPCLNELGADGVIRPRQPVEQPWMEGFEWNQASMRMAGYFDRVRRPIYTQPADKTEAPGLGIPVSSKHQISW